MTINIDEIIEELRLSFIDQNCKIFYNEIEKQEILFHYKKCLNSVFNFSEEQALKDFSTLANLKLLQYTPYTIVFNELAFIQTKVLDYLLKNNNITKIYKLCKLFKKIENRVAKIFLTYLI